ncbi:MULTISPECIES: amidohydrolase [unclassified Aliiroseovarius]|uniref:amidohydrolase n=1 Tax=unclassified Aliiroseovarius TaxID=2623558 RepID=UPI00156A1977|nr:MULTISPECIES: amidohydrolase [unclassified Aliiroseovarius]NRP12041.1 N-substituted formamide deformylase [Aliiroseovarius sp. xm-d-517]NRP41465.1 N-substituted formamide deformylase [Aliiroseovarius sp. xm-m-339-2]NRP44817.1 N-substituted formamide deformylase [Aliiroseovarius sp. xm-m-378]NRP62471.1 N-substituted formamide deformylase [Aliiroseovarius sp. xm-a-151]NRP65688.1 N-substituted formamide deformylase [Aliiroseovarius sp. xm-v-225]
MTSTLYFNGPILTMDAHNTMPEAVLTEGQTILAVGSEAELRAVMPKDSLMHDLDGCTMIPAFIDPHGHFPDPGFIKLFRVNLAAPPRGDCTDIASALTLLSQKATQTPAGEWVMGVSLDNTAIAEGRLPTRDELDQVSTAHPIWVIHASGHNGSANSLALQMQGIDRHTPDPLGGRFGRDPDTGELTGLIEGISAMGEMGNTDFLIDRDRFWQGFNATRDEYLTHGVTYAQNAWATREMLDHFASLPANEDPGFDLMLLPIGELEPALTTGADAISWPGNPHFTLGPRKLFTDGAFQLQTAYLSAPYHKPHDPAHPCGMPYVSEEDHRAQVKKLHDLGYQIHCHCNGDAGAEMFINAVEEALRGAPRADHRHTIIHGQTLRDDQLQRMAKLGITVSFFSAHIHFWGDLHHDTLLGPDRAARISPTASAEKFGVRYTIHNDASVTPTRPIHLAHCAVNRMTSGGRVLGEEQKIGVMSALRAQTIDAAWQVFQEDSRGSIETGKLADFAILSRNPLETPERLVETKVSTTIRRGMITH